MRVSHFCVPYLNVEVIANRIQFFALRASNPEILAFDLPASSAVGMNSTDNNNLVAVRFRLIGIITLILDLNCDFSSTDSGSLAH